MGHCNYSLVRVVTLSTRQAAAIGTITAALVTREISINFKN